MSSGEFTPAGMAGQVVASSGPRIDKASILARLAPGVARTRDHLLSLQHPDGHWCAELQGDTILESEYILLLAFLGQGQSERAKECAAYMLDQQCDHGGWAMFPGGPIEISGSVKAYLALKITGHDPQADYMVRAREAILRAGGVEQVNSFTRYYLAMLGVIPYNLCPAVPPEMILLPLWAPFNIYEMSSWSRTIVVPLSLLWACQPKTSLPPEHQIDELYASPSKTLPRTIGGVNHEGSRGWLNWTKFFQQVDRLIKFGEGLGIKPLRKRAIRLCEQWILDRLKMSDGLGAIFPPIVWTIIGLRCLGYKDDCEIIQQQMRELDKLCIRENGKVRLQPCFSPVWDTIISIIALRDAGVSRHDPAIRKSIEWVLSKEVKHPGDWSLNHPNVEPGGWYFEYNNEFYPDIDDTCMTLIAFGKCLPEGVGREWTMEVFDEPKTGTPARQTSEIPVVFSGRSATAEKAIAELEAAAPMVNAIRRGVRWLKAMQSSDGGWGAFDADNTREVLTKVPFADHNAMIDPSTSDITARVLESFAGLGIPADSEIHKRAFDFIWKDQQPDHCWYGRWGVNYLYGTWQVLVGLIANGVPADDPRLRKAVEWLKAKQQPCGGWGETARSYDDPNLRGTGVPTASQTAWALLGLLAAGEAESTAVQRGVDYLLSTQQPDGTWNETEFTGTGFPRVFYLRYHYYPLYFPLMALARYAQSQSR
ncbi:MAG: prenyltransferase/squalene oxidase repeat-containing protein [Planctomycetaceae bacterium]